MKKLIVSALFASLVIGGCAESPPKSEHSLPVNINGPYSIIVLPFKAEETIYGLKCNSGTTDCAYNWESLCKTGTAKNTTPFGGVAAMPGYSRAKDGTPVRIFICSASGI